MVVFDPEIGDAFLGDEDIETNLEEELEVETEELLTEDEDL